MSYDAYINPRLDLSASPYDLRTAQQFIHAHVKARLAAQENCPLVVLYGEQHQRTSHVLLFQMVVDQLHKDVELRKTYRLGVGLECPVDIIDRIMPQHTHLTDQQQLQILLNTHTFDHTPEANHNALTHLIQRNISTRFIDAAQSADFIDRNHPTTCAAMDHNDWPDRSFSIGTPESMALRNAVIVELARAHMSAEHLKLYVIKCGRAHVSGFAAKSMAYEDSLTARFHRAGYNVLPVCHTSPHDTHNALTPACMVAPLLQRGLPFAHVNGLATETYAKDEAVAERGFIRFLQAKNYGRVHIYKKFTPPRHRFERTRP